VTDRDSQGLGSEYPIELLPPASVDLPLWRSLPLQLRDRFAPEIFPPLHLTSRPMDLGMLMGDRISLPWYRTIFSNLGDVITPETQPPLELESRPVDVGELIGDQLERGWWTSVLRNLADSIAPENLPPLELTSAPVTPEALSTQLLVPRWSALVPTPRTYLYPLLRPASASLPMEGGGLKLRSAVATAGSAVAMPNSAAFAKTRAGSGMVRDLTAQTRRALRRARLREGIWIGLAIAETVFLVMWHFTQR